MVDGAEWLATEEACQLLGVSRRTLVRWIGEHPVERQTVFGERGKSYLYSRAALLQVLRQVRGEEAGAVAQNGAECPASLEGDDAQLRHSEPRSLARPLDAHAEEFLDLLADLRDVVARAAAKDAEVGTLREEIHQLREVLAARLPAPSPPAPQPRVRWRACTEVALLGVVTVLAGAMVAAVARVLQINGAIVLPW